MKKYRFNKQNRMNKRNKRRTASRCRDTIEGLRIPKYVNHEWNHSLEVPIGNDETVTVGITDHAAIRMTQRRISKEAIAVVLRYGRQVHAQNAIVYFFGKNEFKRHLSLGQHAGRWEKFRDIHVIVSAENNAIITCYKNSKISIRAEF